MDVNSLALYIHELRNQCLYVEASYAAFNEALQTQNPTKVFLATQNILTSASAISAILWPKGTRSRRRGEALREALQLPAKHALNDRRLISLWEDSDEKTEAWVNGTKGEEVMSDFIAPLSRLTRPISEKAIYRGYDPETNVLYFRGQSFHLQGLANALVDVAQRINVLHARLMPELHQQPAAPAEAPAETAES